MKGNGPNELLQAGQCLNFLSLITLKHQSQQVRHLLQAPLSQGCFIQGGKEGIVDEKISISTKIKPKNITKNKRWNSVKKPPVFLKWPTMTPVANLSEGGWNICWSSKVWPDCEEDNGGICERMPTYHLWLADYPVSEIMASYQVCNLSANLPEWVKLMEIDGLSTK